MKRTLMTILAMLLAGQAAASFPEFFGTGPTTSGIGNQANMDYNDPSNTYYIPALLAFADTVSFTASASNVTSSFKDINNIVVTNSTNTTVSTSTDVTTGNALTDYGAFQSSMINFVLPVRYKSAGSINISISTPIGRIMETNTGDAHLPEYVMFHSRYKRTQAFANYSHPINETWAFSLGAHLGYQAGANFQTQVSLGNNYGSSGNTKMEIEPSLGAIFSVAARTMDSFSYFTFQQEMKSNFEAYAFGDITDPPLALINIGISSMMYYDPHIFRLGYGRYFSDWGIKLYGALEYQLWENYKTPVIHIVNHGGSVRSSNDYEKPKLRNVFYPRVGIDWRPYYRTSYKLGLAYRQTPFDSDFSGAGNSLDANTIITSAGFTYDMRIYKHDVQFGVSGQYHMLEETKVTKTAGQENGSSGQKIGAPGFTVGGNALLATIGMKVLF